MIVTLPVVGIIIAILFEPKINKFTIPLGQGPYI